jgi:negative regulator of flagellin synthesis FlgM
MLALRVFLKGLVGRDPSDLLKFSESTPLKVARLTEVLDVNTKITGFENRPVQVGTDKKVSRAGDSATPPAESAAAGVSPVRITDAAKQLAALEQTLQGSAPVNEARVNAIRSAIEEGRYQVNPEVIADKLMRVERELSN